MSEPIKHECGIVFLRLLKPLQFYKEKYGTALYGLNKMYLLLEKQHNRGQDGAGLANIKLDIEPGQRYISRIRSNKSQPIRALFKNINKKFKTLSEAKLNDCKYLQKNIGFTGEAFIGHLRYATYGNNSIENCHPFLRQNNWRSRNLIVAGNFNLTNVNELFNNLVQLGQHPKEKADTVTLIERIGHFLDEINEELYQKYRKKGHSKQEITQLIATHLDVSDLLKRSFKKFDGGYVLTGLLGHGDGFVMRDPAGIRPAYYYQDEEIVVVASERPVIQTVFNVQYEDVKPLDRGAAIIVKKDGKILKKQILKQLPAKQCTFERIYFSRGSDKDIYKERQDLGRLICPEIIKTIGNDIENTVFSFIPNTAEIAFYGMIKGLEDYLNDYKAKIIKKEGARMPAEALNKLLSIRPRVEKLAIKDVKMRTFIAAENSRNDMAKHVYDITYGAIRPEKDSIVLIDDSIVRGTTLKQSILSILSRLKPKEIIIISSAPQIRFPDCYGIDMARIQDFVAFRAAADMLIERGEWHLSKEIYTAAIAENKKPANQIKNVVKRIYAPFTYQEISNKIAQLLKPEEANMPVKIIYQTIENLHKACPQHSGDWYFTGNYPTPGGNRVANKAFINFIEHNDNRAY